jgi:hypothetical protein
MTRLYNTGEERAVILDWLRSERTLADMAARYAISAATIGAMRRNIDGEYSPLLRSRVTHAIREWKRDKSGSPEPEQIDLPGMPPTRRSILLDMIQKELDAAGDDRLERIYKAIITA